MSGSDHSFALLHGLEHGWNADHPDPPRALLLQLASKLRGERDVRESRADVLLGQLDLPQIRLQGVARLPCLVLGPAAEIAREVRAFWDRCGGPGQLVLVASALVPVLEQARAVAPPHRCLFLGPMEIRDILEALVPKEAFTRLIRTQIPRSRLDPYHVTLPVEGPMFFGREAELALLRDKELNSYAIAGPGRIGKTSLMREYARRLRVARDPRVTRLHDRLSLYGCGGYTEDGLARHMAGMISATSMAARVTVDTLAAFLNIQKELQGGPLELLIDEVDEVCFSNAFRMLIQAARDKLCRLVLCGRGNLLHAMLDDRHPLAGRVDLIRPEPLEQTEAARLVAEPLADFGLELEHASELHARIYHLTSGLPHLVQSIAHRLLQRAHQMEALTVTPVDLNQVEQDFMGHMVNLLPLRDLENDQSRLAALLLLEHNPKEVRVGILHDLLAGAGCQLELRQVQDILDDLVICNLLVWTRANYRLANPELSGHVRESGFLPRELQTLWKRLNLGSRPKG
jgi:hypothetical protein